MSGAAGGLAGGLWATFDARLRSGAELVIDEVGLRTRLAESTCLLSGEGRLDSQSLDGKLIGTLADLCRTLPRPLYVVAGQVDLAPTDLGASGIEAAVEGSTLEEIAAAALRVLRT
jgi:glycerate kinase